MPVYVPVAAVAVALTLGVVGLCAGLANVSELVSSCDGGENVAAAAITKRCMPRKIGDTADTRRRSPFAMGDGGNGGLAGAMSVPVVSCIWIKTKSKHNQSAAPP